MNSAMVRAVVVLMGLAGLLGAVGCQSTNSFKPFRRSKPVEETPYHYQFGPSSPDAAAPANSTSYRPAVPQIGSPGRPVGVSNTAYSGMAAGGNIPNGAASPTGVANVPRGPTGSSFVPAGGSRRVGPTASNPANSSPVSSVAHAIPTSANSGFARNTGGFLSDESAVTQAHVRPPATAAAPPSMPPPREPTPTTRQTPPSGPSGGSPPSIGSTPPPAAGGGMGKIERPAPFTPLDDMAAPNSIGYPEG